MIETRRREYDDGERPEKGLGGLPSEAYATQTCGDQPTYPGLQAAVLLKGGDVASVEVAYFTLPEFEGRGFATAVADALVGIARATDPGLVVAAQTQP